jgi:hypothetical protein
MSWATFWAISSQTHLVTLMKSVVLESQAVEFDTGVVMQKYCLEILILNQYANYQSFRK